MNVASRVLHHRVIAKQQLPLMTFTAPQPLIVAILLLMIFCSAFAIVYVTHVTRGLHANLHQSSQDYSRLYAKQEQLLLDKSSLFMQTRIQKIAENSLNMIIPDRRWVVMVHEPKNH
jgi:cell division protein FtsL